MNTVFISILIESLPFVLIGVFLAGIIQMFVSEQMVARIMPKNRVLAVLMATILGALFPACECGIIPIVRRLVSKGVPMYAGIAFMLTGPVINPVVLFSTYVAFGNSWDMMIYRGGLAMLVAALVGIILSYQFKNEPLLLHPVTTSQSTANVPFGRKLLGTLTHAVDEFFSVGKYLVIGALVAAAMQTYIQTSTLLEIGQSEAASSLVMMGLAFVLSLCSEADAFIASSFQTTFSTGSLVAFLVYGPMLDVKNTLMMLGTFKKRLVISIITYVTLLVFVGSLFF
ncbi:permease [Fictibacillus iocasae]|uniref:Permease n=1 Tax=Fictibacillus iocasae TaxID=2715437 RepID=A0ABW2NLL7_9BACL